MRVFEKHFMVRPDVLYCGNVAILGKQNIRFDCRAEELLYAQVPGGANECRASPTSATRRGHNLGHLIVQRGPNKLVKFIRGYWLVILHIF